MRFLAILAFSAIFAVVVIAQTNNHPATQAKPTISNITALPADAPASGNCTASRSGYFETTGKEKMTEAKLAKFVSSSLHDGFVLTIYPATKRGIFVNMECPAKSTSTASITP